MRSPTDNHLKVAFTGQKRVDSYDPAHIRFAPEYFLLESLYSTLIERPDDGGGSIPSVAKEYYWKGNDLHFVIREDLTTIDGHSITIDDVLFSLKRLIILSENTHGDFKNLICPDAELKSVEEDCPRMVKKGNTLILKMDAQWDFLIPMLAAIDFAIIPRRSVDPKTLKITDYRNTSGPYYVKKDEGKGNILLCANPQHFHFHKDMAEQIALIPTAGMNQKKVLNLFNANEINCVSALSMISFNELKNIDRSNVHIHETIPIRMKLAYITEKGKRRLPLEKRLAFAKLLQQSFHAYYADKEGYENSKQFFLPFGQDGPVLDEKMESVDTEIVRLGEDIFLGIYESKENGLEALSKIAKTGMPKLNTAQAKGLPAFTNLSDEDTPDYIIVKTDSGHPGNLNLLSYTMNSGLFGLSKEEGKAWLKDYMKAVDKKERDKKLKKMELDSLLQGWMVPLFSTPYITITKKPWEAQLSNFYPNSPLWKIRRK